MAWPSDWVEKRRFRAWLEERVDGDHASVSPERRDDLYIACACLGGNLAAIAAFEDAYFGEVDRAMRRLRPGGISSDEVRQQLRQKLFVGDGERPPGLASYTGRGPLGTWFRVVTTRIVLDYLDKRKEQATSDELLEAITSGEDGVETSHLRKVYREELKTAFGDATQRLTDRERSILRYAFVDGLGVDGLAAVYKIHRATAARRLDAARESLGDHLRQVLTERLAVSEAELGSIVRLVLSSVDLTVARYLGRRE